MHPECPEIRFSAEIIKVEHSRAQSIFRGRLFQHNQWLPEAGIETLYVRHGRLRTLGIYPTDA